jgi:hypothetical protein
MQVISLDSDDEDDDFKTVQTVVTPKRGGKESIQVTTIQKSDSNLLNTSFDLDADIYDLILGKKESELRQMYGKPKQKDYDSTDTVEFDDKKDEHAPMIDSDDSTKTVEYDSPEKHKTIPKKNNGSQAKENATTTINSSIPIELIDDSDSSQTSKPKSKKKIDGSGTKRTKSKQVETDSDSSQRSDTKRTKKRPLEDSQSSDTKRRYVMDDSDSGYDSNSTKKADREFLRRAKGVYALDELHVHIDSNLTNTVGGKVIREQLELHFDQSKITVCELPIAHSIRWFRHLPSDYIRWLEQSNSSTTSGTQVVMELANYCLIRIPGDTMIELVQQNSIVPYVQTVKTRLLQTPSTTIPLYENDKPLTLILLVEGLHAYIKSLEQARYKRIMADVNKNGKSKKNDIVIPNIERALLELQLIHGVRIFETTNAASTVQFIAQMTKNLAEAPYKKTTSVLDFKSSSSDGRKKLGLSEIWKKQLVEIPSVSEKIANVVATKYPSVKALLSAYDKCEDGENMLKDIQLDQKRKIGPAASKSIYDIFN